jgi:hypothetical protein
MTEPIGSKIKQYKKRVEARWRAALAKCRMMLSSTEKQLKNKRRKRRIE